MEMPNEYKLLWNFALAKCNHAGIWRPNKVLFTSICGLIDLKKAIEFFNLGKIRVVVLESGNWFFPGFFSFQYGKNFNDNSRVHLSILKIYENEKISLENCYNIDIQTFKDLTSNKPLKEVKDRVKDKDKEKDKDININSLNNKSKEIKREDNFQKPTENETIKFFKNQNSTEMEAGRFFAFYESNGWKVGKNKMKDWKASARGWIMRNLTDKKTGKFQNGTSQDHLRINSGVLDIADEHNRKGMERLGMIPKTAQA
ncbi:MAG: hypothetical protein IPM51_12055 [Sphingobacteriaceae bacterium]|nr:hypothetical protein [Sphingobacteriaceae bacterium]